MCMLQLYWKANVFYKIYLNQLKKSYLVKLSDFRNLELYETVGQLLAKKLIRFINNFKKCTICGRTKTRYTTGI